MLIHTPRPHVRVGIELAQRRGEFDRALFDPIRVLGFVALTFINCYGAYAVAPVYGAMTLVVTSASTATLTVDTSAVNLSVLFPVRAVTLNGNSTITQTIAGAGADTTTTNHWVSAGIRLDSQRYAGGSTHYELHNVDYTRNIVVVNGMPASSNCVGHSTLDAQLLFLPWLITIATLDPTDYGPTGGVVSGRWSIDLPDDHLELQITPTSVLLLVDLGADGNFELRFLFSLDTFFDAAG